MKIVGRGRRIKFGRGEGRRRVKREDEDEERRREISREEKRGRR